MLVVPEPCETPTAQQFGDLQLMIVRGEYRYVQELVDAYERHCCEDDALSGRDTSRCEE